MLKVAWSWSRSLGFIFNFCTPLIPLLLLLLSPSAPSLFLWLIFLLLFLFDIIFSPCWVFGLLSVILPMAAQGFNVNWSQCVAPCTMNTNCTIYTNSSDNIQLGATFKLDPIILLNCERRQSCLPLAFLKYHSFAQPSHLNSFSSIPTPNNYHSFTSNV